jgi:hypothetical protein
MRTEDLQVQKALIDAGYGGRPMECRDAMFNTLSQILKEDLANETFVDQLRTLLSAANKLDSLAELENVRALHGSIKACPCGHRPDTSGFIDSDDQVHVVCLHETEAITRSGATLSEAIACWNRDDWTDSSTPRAIFPL